HTRLTLFPYTTLFRSWKGGHGGVPALRFNSLQFADQLQCVFHPPDAPIDMREGSEHKGFRGVEGQCSLKFHNGLLVHRLRNVIRSEEHTSELQSRFDL